MTPSRFNERDPNTHPPSRYYGHPGTSCALMRGYSATSALVQPTVVTAKEQSLRDFLYLGILRNNSKTSFGGQTLVRYDWTPGLRRRKDAGR
ncbi:hypothetical protein TNCT_64811 [Trichonephila clavata]|uniref:Uncharacterized protein n=1 Tax=Trichonephila clavata TaxID=2740835 RepID=A0A8X6LJT4_TRICU|nr:hypothetical protein TNCT_64811 [Trichonephila clavata]